MYSGVEAEDATGGVSFGGPELIVDLSDVTPPSFDVGSVLEVSQIEARSAILSWSPASDDVEVVGYRIEMNDLELQTTSGEALTLES